MIACQAPRRKSRWIDIRFQVNPGQVNFRRDRDRSPTRAAGSKRVLVEKFTQVRLNRGGPSVSVGRIGSAADQDSRRPRTACSRSPSITETTLHSQSPRFNCYPSSARFLFRSVAEKPLSSFTTATTSSTPADCTTTRTSSALMLMQSRRSWGRKRRIAAYRGRPDERPWSERHNTILWLAMLAGGRRCWQSWQIQRDLKTKAMSS